MSQAVKRASRGSSSGPKSPSPVTDGNGTLSPTDSVTPIRGPSPSNAMVEAATVFADASVKKRRPKSFTVGGPASPARPSTSSGQVEVTVNGEVATGNGKEEKSRRRKHSRSKSIDKDKERGSRDSKKENKRPSSSYDGLSISDIVIHGVLNQFMERATQRVPLIAVQESTLLSEHFRRGVDPVFERLLQAVVSLARHGLDIVSSSLLQWREDWFKSPLTSQARKELWPEGNQATGKNASKEGTDERVQLVLDFILVSTARELLRPTPEYNPKLSDDVSSKYEKLAFDRLVISASLVNRSDKESPTLVENRRQVRELFMALLGTLSIHRFTAITHILLSELGSRMDTKSSSKLKLLEATPIAQSLGALKVDPSVHIEETVTFLESLVPLFKDSKRIELKHALCKSLIDIISYWTEDAIRWQAVVSSEAVQNHLQAFYTKAAKWSKKTKHTHNTYPLVAMLVSVMEPSQFEQHSWEVMQSLMKLIRDKPRSSSLHAVFTLIRCSLLQETGTRGKNDDKMSQSLDRLLKISTQIFAFGKKSQVWPEPVYDLLVKVILEVADHHLDFAVEHLILKLLDNEQLNENVLVGLRALTAIFQGKTKANIGGGDAGTAVPKELQSYIVPVGDHFAKILNQCDIQLGTVVATLHNRPVAEVIGKDKLTQLTVYRHALLLIPYLWPGQLTRDNLAQILLKCTNHLDPQIKKTASSVLETLMTHHPRVRATIIHEAVELVGNIPDSHAELIENGLRQLLSWLAIWEQRKSTSMTNIPHHRRQSSDPPAAPLDCPAVEGIALVYLASPRPTTRQVCLRLLEAIRGLSASLSVSNTSSSMLEPRVMDVVEATQPDVIRRYYQDNRYSEWKLDHSSREPPADMTLYRLAGIDQAQDQSNASRWARALGDLVKFCREMCPTAVHKAWTEICGRINKVKPPLESSKSSKEPSGSNTYLWRNFIVFSTSAAPDGVVSSGNLPDATEIKRYSMDTGAVIDSAETLFQSIIPYLSSPVDDHQTAAVTALGRVRPELLEPLFFSLAGLEKEIAVESKEKGKGGRKKKINTRSHILHVYMLIAERSEPGTVVSHDLLFNKLVAVVQENLLYLSQPDSRQFYINQDICMNLSSIVTRLATEVQHYRTHAKFPADLRRKLWYFFARWCDYGPIASQNKDNKDEKMDAKLFENLDISDQRSLRLLFDKRKESLKYNALRAMSAVVLGPLFDEQALSPSGDLLGWVEAVLGAGHHKIRSIGQRAIENLLRSDSKAFNVVLDACYHHETSIAHGYFRALTQVFGQQELDANLAPLLHLVLYMLGDSSKLIRTEAISLFQYTVTRFLLDPTELNKYLIHATSILPDTYLRTRSSISKQLSRDCPNITFEFLNAAFARFKKAPKSRHKQMLEYMVPWLSKLSFLSHRDQDMINTLLGNLLSITLDHRTYQDHLPTLWAAFAGNVENIGPIIDYLLKRGMSLEDSRDAAMAESQTRFLECAKRVAVFVSRVSPAQTIDKLVSELALKNAPDRGAPNSLSRDAATNSDLLTHRQRGGVHRRRAQTVVIQRQEPETFGQDHHHQPGEIPTTPSLVSPQVTPTRKLGKGLHSSLRSNDDISVSGRERTSSEIHLEHRHHRHETTGALITLESFAELTRANLALMLLTDVVYERGEDVRPYLGTIIHVATLCMDHPLPTVFEHAKQIIVHLAQGLVLDNLPTRVPLDDPRAMAISDLRERATLLVDYILSTRGPLWPYEDVSIHKTTLQSHETVRQFVTRVLQVFAPLSDTASNRDELAITWSEQALGWIVSECPRHLANRSCQIYRVVCHPRMARSANDLLDCLTKAVNRSSLENLTFTIELLISMKVVVSAMAPSKLILFPQFFWSCVALLHTEFIQVYRCSVDLLVTVIRTLNMEETTTRQVLSASMPREWKSRPILPFKGLAPLLFKGLHSEITEADTVLAFRVLVTLDNCTFIQSESEIDRLVYHTFGLLPWLLRQHASDTPLSRDTVHTANLLASACQEANVLPLAEVLSKFAQGKYDSTVAFTSALGGPLCSAFFPQNHKTVWVLLSEILRYGPVYNNENILHLLASMLNNLNLKESSDYRAGPPSDLRSMLSHVSGIASENPQLAPVALTVLRTALNKLASSGTLHPLSEVSLPPMGSVHDDEITESDPASAARKAGFVFGKDRVPSRRSPIRASRLLHEVLVTCMPSRQHDEVATSGSSVDLEALMEWEGDASAEYEGTSTTTMYNTVTSTADSDTSEQLNVDTEEKLRALLRQYEEGDDV